MRFPAAWPWLGATCAAAVALDPLHARVAAAQLTVDVSVAVPAGHHKWAEGVLGHDGRVYCMPHDAHFVLVIDPRNRTEWTVDYDNSRWEARPSTAQHSLRDKSRGVICNWACRSRARPSVSESWNGAARRYRTACTSGAAACSALAAARSSASRTVRISCW